MRCMIRFVSAILFSSGAVFLPARSPAAGLGFLRDTALPALTDADRKLQGDAILGVLEDANPRTVKEWSNPKSRASGRVQTLGNFQSDAGLHCRKLQMSTLAKGIDSQFSFPVCKSASGEWFIASGMKLTAVK